MEGVSGGVREESDREHQRHESDRDVDEEDPAPGRPRHDRTTNHRSEDGPEEGRHADDSHHSTHAVHAGCSGHDGLADGHQHPASDALHDAEGDQARSRPRQAACRRSDDEQHQRQDVERLGADAVDGPPRDRDHDRQREQIASGHPRDGGDRHVEVLGQRVERHGHDRGVEDGHDRAQHHHDAGAHHLWLEPVVNARLWDRRHATRVPPRPGVLA